VELDTLLLGVVDLLVSRRHLHARATVGQDDLLRAETPGRAGRIHRHIATADHHHALAPGDGCVALAELIGPHEVGAGEELVGRVDAQQVLSRDAHEGREACAGADEYRVEALLLHQVLNGVELADHRAGLELDAEIAECLDLHLQDLLREAELRDAVDKHAAHLVQGFEDGDIVAHLRQLGGGGQARRTGADDGHALAGGLGEGGLLHQTTLALPVGDEALEATDGHRVPLLGQHALDLALVFLRADAAADGGQDVGLLDLPRRLGELALPHETDEAGDIHGDGAALDARGPLALQAAAGLGDRLLGGIAQRNLVEVVDADLGRLLGHGLARGLGGLECHGPVSPVEELGVVGCRSPLPSGEVGRLGPAVQGPTTG